MSQLRTIRGEPLQILNSGQYLGDEGPDFFNAQIIIGNQIWVGNVEIHVKSSDWYLHHHEVNNKYNNVILHVVWEHDAEVFRADNSEIPVLVLKDYVLQDVLSGYKRLIKEKNWIFCEKELQNVDALFWLKWKERLFFERLETKTKPVEILLNENKNDWEATLFCCLAKSFGLNANGDAFFQIAKTIPFNAIRKERHQNGNLEALLLGLGGLLEDDKQDTYFRFLKNRWKELKEKYELSGTFIMPLQFYKLRPGNFPTIRLVQLAQLYQQRINLFDNIIQADSLPAFYKIFNIKMPEYWLTHYLFDRTSTAKHKDMTDAFKELVFINAILPLRFLYAQYFGNDIVEKLTDMVKALEPEKNSITDRFKKLGVTIENAFDSQALLHLKKEYCDYKKCLNCEIGQKLLQ